MKLTVWVVVAVVVLSVSACGSSEPELPCEDIANAAAVAEMLTEGANDTPIEPTGRLGAVKAPAMQDAYMVAMEFTVPGDDDPEVGVWSLTALDGRGPVLSIDAFAASVTDWPNQMNGKEFNIAEPGAHEAVACLS